MQPVLRSGAAMPVSVRARNVFDQMAENDNVPAARRRLAHAATVLTILATAVALVLVHSVPAWFQPNWRSSRGMWISEGVVPHRALPRLAALASLGDGATNGAATRP